MYRYCVEISGIQDFVIISALSFPGVCSLQKQLQLQKSQSQKLQL